MTPRARSIAWILTVGGVAVLAAYHVLSLPGLSAPLDVLLRTAGAVLGYGLLTGGVWLHAARQPAVTAAPPPRASSAHHTPDAPANSLRSVVEAFDAWLSVRQSDTPSWPALDQFIREMLHAHVGALRVRSHRVVGGCLRPLATTVDNTGGELHPRGGIVGHVATTGRPFITTHGPQNALIQALAAEDGRWHAVWPVRECGSTVGVIAIGEIEPSGESAEVLEPLLALLARLWCEVEAREKLRIADLTDKASGVLTRRDFFDVAERTMHAAAQQNEPVVVAILSIEGLRRLDDAGAWTARDRLIEQVGSVLAQRVRSDDIVGRFADERFVLLLRRLDSALGAIVGKTVLEDVRRAIAGALPDGLEVRARFGLAGSGMQPKALDELLVAALESVERARTLGRDTVSDLDADTALIGAGAGV